MNLDRKSSGKRKAFSAAGRVTGEGVGVWNRTVVCGLWAGTLSTSEVIQRGSWRSSVPHVECVCAMPRVDIGL